MRNMAEFNHLWPYLGTKETWYVLTCPMLNPATEFPSFFQPFAVKRALEEAKTRAVDVDGIAFTRGPGGLIAKMGKYVLIIQF